MTLESLLLSRDAEVLRVLRPTLEKLSIDVEIYQEAKKATEILIAEKFDAVIVDCDDSARRGRSIAGVAEHSEQQEFCHFCSAERQENTTQEAFAMGVNFVLQKPINQSECCTMFSVQR